MNYFSVVETGHCSVKRTNEQRFPFDFKSIDSDILLVTVGDSWTWGDDITVDNNNNTRLELVFGNLLSQKLNSDWLNLGQCGSGNFWIAERIQELEKLIEESNYRKVYVICTLTEVGRDFNSSYDQDFDYISWLKINPIDNLIPLLNSLVIDRINLLTKKFNNVILRIGTNFVDHAGLDAAKENLLSIPWINLITEPDTNCFIVGTPTLENFKRSADLFSDNMLFKKWLDELVIQAAHRRSVLNNPLKFRNGHPLADGHRAWADYVLSSL